MSSTTASPWERRAVLIASALLLLWYAKNQVLLTLLFYYQLARLWFPGLIPDFGPPG
jgi:hypothetical protein